MEYKKFTVEEIVKALEYCMKNDLVCSDNCPGQKLDADWKCECRSDLMQNAIDLIKDLKSRIVNYQVKNSVQRKELAMLNKKIVEQKAEIDCLRKELEKLHSHKDFLRAEIERLKTEKDNLIKTYGECMIEVVKEFAHKILALFPADKNHTTISRFTIKQIVKEMTEVKE